MVNMRTPVNKPSGMPPLQVIDRAGLNSLTVTGNVRPRIRAGDDLDRLPGRDSAVDAHDAGMPVRIVRSIDEDRPDPVRRGVDNGAGLE